MTRSLPAHGWTFADVFDHHAARTPSALAVAHADGSVERTWLELRVRAHDVAGTLTAPGLRRHQRVALALQNEPRYMESLYALSVASMAHVNTNYRYSADELVALWTDMDVAAVAFDEDLHDRVDAARRELPRVRWIACFGAGVDVPTWAIDYESLAGGDGSWEPSMRRSGDDPLIICTGGTTGRPKGVLWRQDDLLRALRIRAYGRTEAMPDAFDAALLDELAPPPGPIGLPAAPLMHATGLANGLSWLMAGGAAVTVPGAFRPEALLDAIDRYGVNVLTIVGNAFARPLLHALDASPGQWTLASLQRIVSAGVAWSIDVRAGLLGHRPSLTLIDTLGASEAIGMASAVSTIDQLQPDGVFALSVNGLLFDDDGNPLPDDAPTGRLGVHGHVPLEYLADAARTAEVFPVRGGRRHSVPGDIVHRLSDGRIRLVGRGSALVNTGGEKVYPDEVEAVVRAHPAIADVAVVGRPDHRWGEVVVAVVEPVESGVLDEASVV